MSKPDHSWLLGLAVAAASSLSGAAVAQRPAAQPPPAVRMLEVGKPIERTLTGGESHVYAIALTTGQHLSASVHQRGIDVVVAVVGPDGRQLVEVDSPTGAQGAELVAFAAPASGTYRLKIQPFDAGAAAGRYEVRVDELLTAAQHAARVAAQRVRDDSVVAWLARAAVPLRSVHAGSGFADLQPIKDVLRGVRIVALGEATHGSREFFQLKHRMLEFLVREMGFRVFAIEASYSASHNVINEYVMGGPGDGGAALDSQGFWTWNTQEVRALIEWMRAYNQAAPPGRRVKFVGFDIQVNRHGEQVVLAYLRKAAPERAAAADSLFRAGLDSLARLAFSEDPAVRASAVARLSEVREKYQQLLGYLTLSERWLSRRTSATEFSNALQHARVLAQHADAYSRPIGSDDSLAADRDYYMAENFQRLLEAEPPGTRVVVWAHNGHIAASGPAGAHPPMGAYLRKWYGDEYYALGLSFNQGAFQARDLDPRARRALTEFWVGPAPEGSVEWYLARARVKTYVVDFRRPRKPNAVRQWLAARHLMRSIGSGFMATWGPAESMAPAVLAEQYDGLVFVDSTTRARPNPSVPNVAPMPR